MKKSIILFIAFCLTVVFAAEGPVFVNVELLSGTKQRAQYLGIKQDTVRLGGYIKGRFTIVRLAKDKFKSIVDEQGNDLLNDTLHTADLEPQIFEEPEAPQTPVVLSDSQQVMYRLTEFANQQTQNVFISADDKISLLIYDLLSHKINRLEHLNGKKLRSVCNDNVCAQNLLRAYGADTLYFCERFQVLGIDSIGIKISTITFEDSLPTIKEEREYFSQNNLLDDVLANAKMKNFLAQVLGEEIQKENTKGYIHVETSIEGATLSLGEKDAVCKTPCTFVVENKKKVNLYAYWNVESELWGAESVVRIIPNDTVKISMKLRKSRPEIHIGTLPVDVEVFAGSDSITAHSKAIGRAPFKFSVPEPGISHVTLRKVGYKDTTVAFYAKPVSDVFLSIPLEAETDFNMLEKQEEWANDRKIIKAGKIMMGASIAPIIVGGVIAYLGKFDYDKADDIKKDLQKPGAQDGANRQEKIKENKKFVDKGDEKIYTGFSLMGAGVVLLGLGFVLNF